MAHQGSKGRKLLVAAIGVATVSYVVGCSDTASTTTGDTGADTGISSGNLMPPEDTGRLDTGAADSSTSDGATDAKGDATTDATGEAAADGGDKG